VQSGLRFDRQRNAEKRCVTSNNKPLVVIVDNDESVCQELDKLARSAGMEADTFTSNQEFVDVIEAMPWLHVDCVVLEVLM